MSELINVFSFNLILTLINNGNFVTHCLYSLGHFSSSSQPFQILLYPEDLLQWNHACFGIRRVSKRTGSNPVHGPSVGSASSLGATVS
ncbi:hypothetical protein E2C01_055983 [Portunus trituberculatus]|uniref:Uncharacterized protein n=1 Tax=Portunus trituberculatus TaxID=210409 RepID=A0A5B7GW62_PORTR|nr:hypothetical protein [Portunus trituberculatus]